MATTASASFEDEILALNPEYDLVFSKNKNNNNENLRSESPHALEPSGRWSSPHKMKIISKMNEILNAKPLGELPTQNDWEDNQSVEVETISLMRKLGLEQSIDRPPDERRTIATVPVSEDVIFMKNGHKKMSIFMSDQYFELKPRSEPSFDLDDSINNLTAEESRTSDFSDDVHIYQPISESTLDTESTSLSEDRQDEKASPSRVAYKPMDSGLSTASEKRNSSDGSYVNGWTRVKPTSQQPKFQNKHTSNSQEGSYSGSFNDSGTSSNSSGSSSKKPKRTSRRSKNWRNINDSSSDVQEANNWRLNMAQPRLAKVEPEVSKKSAATKESSKLNETVTIRKGTSKPDDVSNCGRTLYKPKDLFIKKKAMLIQQVLAEYQS